jgi:anti-sigma factor RsiW
VLVPAGALLAVVAILIAGRLSTSSPLSGRDVAQFAASIHRQHLRGNLALEEQTDSQALLDEWLHRKSQFALALPASSEMPREPLPYRIEGARLIGIHDKGAAYIAYRMQPDLISLIVTPVSVAVASGGAEVSFKKVTFHYYSIEGYKVVTWSVHGLTYALVSQEGNRTQRSCMVCHSTMRDRDLTNTPTPLGDQRTLGVTHLR